MTNDTIIRRFVKGEYSHKGLICGNLSIRENVLYTYLTQLAYVSTDIGGRAICIINADRHSSTSSMHRRLVEDNCKENKVLPVLVSLRGIDTARLSNDWYNRLDITVIDATPPVSLEWKEGDEAIEIAKKRYLGGEWYVHTTYGREKFVRYHRAGTVLIEHPYNLSHWVAGFDDSQYFMSKLPIRCLTVNDAFKALQPTIVKEAIAEGKEVLRQGEWFFIPVSITGKGLKFRQGALPQSGNTNYHVCRHVIHDNKILCAANTTVFHRNRRGSATGEHPPLKLGNSIYQAVLNTALESYSIGGRFD